MDDVNRPYLEDHCVRWRYFFTGQPLAMVNRQRNKARQVSRHSFLSNICKFLFSFFFGSYFSDCLKLNATYKRRTIFNSSWTTPTQSYYPSSQLLPHNVWEQSLDPLVPRWWRTETFPSQSRSQFDSCWVGWLRLQTKKPMCWHQRHISLESEYATVCYWSVKTFLLTFLHR